MSEGRFHLWAVGAACAAFALLVAASLVNLFAYRTAVAHSARQDLEARAEVASRFLEEPLRTLDFARIRRFGDECRARGYELSIRSSSGGKIFDTRSAAADEDRWLSAASACGENAVLLCRPRHEVFAPFGRALRLFLLAVLVGAAGMSVVFFALYRQRVRIRELKRVERFRREFIADVSHEIKTPLTGILGAVDLLGGESGDTAAGAQGRVLLGLIRREAGRLNALVQSILDLARLEREGEALSRAPTDVVALIREVVDARQPEARAAGVTLTFEPLVATLTASVDGQLLAQAVTNLVANALRHSQSPDVAVSVGADARAVRVVVEDHGIGIPPAERARVFERFHRVDPSRAAETGGAGLGLAIVRRIVRLHGGDVALASASPHGCRFEVTFPSRGGRNECEVR